MVGVETSRLHGWPDSPQHKPFFETTEVFWADSWGAFLKLTGQTRRSVGGVHFVNAARRS